MTDDARLRAAAHESGHATAAWLLGRHVVAVSLNGPFGGPCSIDKLPPEPLQGRNRRPLPHHHQVEDEILVVLAGDLSEPLADEYDKPEPDVTGPPRRVPDPPPDRAAVPLPVSFQDPLEREPEWPTTLFSDRDQAELLTRSITSSDEEFEAFLHALTLRARAFVRHRHFRALHRHLTEALLRDDTLFGPQVQCELERAELRHVHGHLTTTIPEDTDDGPEAA